MTDENGNAGADDVWAGLSEATKDINFEDIKSKVPADYADMFKDVKSMKGLLSSYADTKKMVGQKVESAIPKDGATAEEWAKFYSKLGVPEKVEDYELKYQDVKLPEAIEKKVRDSFKANNLSKKQAEAVYKSFLELQVEQDGSSTAEYKKFTEDQIKERKMKYGQEFDKVDGAVKGTIDKVSKGDANFKKALETLLDDNKFFDLFHDISKGLTEDNPNGPGTKDGGYKNMTAEQRIKALRDDKEFMRKYQGGYSNISQKDTQEARALMTSLYEQAAKEKK